ncbi:kinase-like protein [Rhizophagus irregularis]|uniref:Kinase-like protein n=1 Tax=Rhizophagus irregularis TaxID=588596 RepID=A0A2N0Q4Z1_9GLOM|nr:kinase-like protein [Rhizophagus irregularis]
MDILDDSKNTSICMQCNQRIINYSNQLCRKQFLSPSRINEYSKIRSVQINQENKIESGNLIIDEFIKETQLNSKCCDDFIEWVSCSNLENIKYLTFGGNSKIYSGTWKLNQLSTNIALKVTKNFNNINDNILNELKIHHKCRSQNIIPFYGITKSPEGDEYAMIIKHAEHGDLRNYIRKFFPKLTWTDRIKILIELSKALNSLHQMNLLHMDFHCKNILVDEADRIFLSDFGLCQPIDSEMVSSSIQGVLPYIAPEVLRNKPYTKQSEVYSISMIMWELTSNKPPFSNKHHDVELALSILDGLRPNTVEGTPDFYTNIMKQCWDSDPLKRPDASLLPKIFEEMIELCKMADDKTVSSKVAFYSLPPQIESERETKSFGFDNMLPAYHSESEEKLFMSNENSFVDIDIEPDYETKAYEYSLNIPQVPQELPPSPLLSASQHPPSPFQSSLPAPPPPPPFPPFQSSLPAPPPPLRRSRLPEASQFPKSGYRYQMEDADINEIEGGYRYKMEDVDINETEEDPRYNTQTYAFSLDHLNKAYTELINNRSRLSDFS